MAKDLTDFGFMEYTQFYNYRGKYKMEKDKIVTFNHDNRNIHKALGIEDNQQTHDMMMNNARLYFNYVLESDKRSETTKKLLDYFKLPYTQDNVIKMYSLFLIIEEGIIYMSIN